MAAAYEYADGGQISPELALSRYIERFGVQGVFGRPIGAGEIRSILLAENIVHYYRLRSNYTDDRGNVNWTRFAKEYPAESHWLVLAIKAANGE